MKEPSKEERKRLLIEMMKEDEKNGMYEVPSKTDNELIAEFMGLVNAGNGLWYFESSDGLRTYFQKCDLKYEVSWDWLHTVVDKIQNLMPSIKIPEHLDALKNGTHGSETYMDVISIPISAPINDVYKAVVSFIKWYNNSQQHERK